MTAEEQGGEATTATVQAGEAGTATVQAGEAGTATVRWWDPADDFTPMEAFVLAEAIEAQITTAGEIDMVSEADTE